MDTLEKLEDWYHAQCNGVWEHSYGIAITTLDNPGWRLRVDVRETSLAQRPFAELKRDYDHSTDWLICNLQDGEFRGACGPRQLVTMIQVFLAWAYESEPA